MNCILASTPCVIRVSIAKVIEFILFNVQINPVNWLLLSPSFFTGALAGSVADWQKGKAYEVIFNPLLYSSCLNTATRNTSISS